MPSQSSDIPQFPPAPPGRGTHGAGSRFCCLPPLWAATAASPAVFSKLFPWPRLTPALGLSCSLLSSFSLKKSRNNGNAEGAELIYAAGSPALLYSSPRSSFGDPHGHDSSLDCAGATIPPSFPPLLGYDELVECDIVPLPAPASASYQYRGLLREMEDFFQGENFFFPMSNRLVSSRKSIFPFGRDA